MNGVNVYRRCVHHWIYDNHYSITFVLWWNMGEVNVCKRVWKKIRNFFVAWRTVLLLLFVSPPEIWSSISCVTEINLNNKIIINYYQCLCIIFAWHLYYISFFYALIYHISLFRLKTNHFCIMRMNRIYNTSISYLSESHPI